MNRSRAMIVTGVILVVASLGLGGYNLYDDYRSHIKAEEILEKLEERMCDEKNEQSHNSLDIEESEYCGILSIPQIDLRIPVSSKYTFSQMKKSLCRYAGSLDKNNMVICGHNNRAFLGRLDEVYEGDSVYYTDMNGREYEFLIIITEYLDGDAVDKMLEDSEEWDLSVFTCNYSGNLRYVIRCKMK